jgi:Golgi phosphoprotein 3 (GPP34)
VADVDLSRGVAVRLSALCLDERGRLSERLIASDAVRGGLFVDLALAGRIESTDDSIVLDEQPTGFQLADRLLSAVATEPERSLDDWLGERRLGLREVAVANVESGRWQVQPGLPFGRRRFADTGAATTAADRRRSWSGPAEGGTPQDAAVTAIAMAAGLLDREHGYSTPPPESLVAATAPADWLCAVVVEHIRGAAVRYAAEASGFSPF